MSVDIDCACGGSVSIDRFFKCGECQKKPLYEQIEKLKSELTAVKENNLWLHRQLAGFTGNA